MKDKFLASLYGFIIGDALGVPVEFKTREYLEQNPVTDMMDNVSRNTTKGYWSDDTAMTLCTMKSIIDMDEINFEIHNDMMKNYLKWLEEGFKAVNNKCFGIGQTVFRVLTNYKMANSFEAYCIQNFESPRNGGNGAMMRILPLILYLYIHNLPKYKDVIETALIYRKYDFIEFNVGITHQYKVNVESCIFYTMFIFNLLDTNDLNKAYDLSIEQHLLWYSGCQSSALKRILDKKIRNLSKDEIQSSGYVVDTLEASIWCLFNTKSYEEAVLTAINLGGDADTIGAITGSLAGLYYGIEQIPKKWLNVLCEKEMLDKDINNFINKTFKNNIINHSMINASSHLRSNLWMKYIRIIAAEQKSKKEEYKELLNELKIELCKFHDYVLTLLYKDSEKGFRNDTLFAIEDFIEIVENRIDGDVEELDSKEKNLLNRFNILRKMSNKYTKKDKNSIVN